MRNRTRMIAAAAAATAALVGSSAAATAPVAGAAPTTGTRSCPTGKPAPASDQSQADSQLAARLGVSTTRLEQALRQVKLSLSKSGATPTQFQFDATLARLLGVSLARVRQVFPVVTATPAGIKVAVSGSAGSKAPATACAKPPHGKGPVPQPQQQQGDTALTAAVASELHLSTSQVSAALQPLFAAGSVDPSSPAFATAAKQLGVSVQQLVNALTQAKQSLASAS
jgi:DNA-binding transcriptional regulator YdaS (Cro superfamily)